MHFFCRCRPSRCLRLEHLEPPWATLPAIITHTCSVTARIRPRQQPYSAKWSSGQQCLAPALVPTAMPTSHPPAFIHKRRCDIYIYIYMDLGTVRQAVERELKVSKGLQEILVAGECRSVESHLKIAWADTVEEARLCFRRGAVRNKDRWAFTTQPMHRSEDLSFLFHATFASGNLLHKGH